MGPRVAATTPTASAHASPRPGRDPGRLRADLEQHGYCIVERALDGAQLERVRCRLFAQAAAERELHQMKNPANTDPVNQWVGMLLNKGEPFLELVQHELCMSLVEHLVGPDWLVSCVDAQIQHPGSGVMPLHIDQWWMPAPQRAGDPPARPAAARRGTGTSRDPSPAAGPIAPIACANVMWMVTDFTDENGATRLVPGSHLSGRQPDPAVPHPVPTVAATGPAGTAFAFDARLWHGAGANRTRSSRYGITTVGCGPQFRQLENYSRGLRPEALARCPETLRRRLGFAAWSSYGHTGDPDAAFSLAGDAATGPLGSETHGRASR